MKDGKFPFPDMALKEDLVKTAEEASERETGMIRKLSAIWKEVMTGTWNLLIHLRESHMAFCLV